MCVVDAIADDENVGHSETNEIRVDRHLAAARLVDKRAGQDGPCFLLAEQIARITERTPRIHDVINKQHRAADKVKLGLADEAQGTRTFSPKAVAAQPYKLDA